MNSVHLGIVSKYEVSRSNFCYLTYLTNVIVLMIKQFFYFVLKVETTPTTIAGITLVVNNMETRLCCILCIDLNLTNHVIVCTLPIHRQCKP